LAISNWQKIEKQNQKPKAKILPQMNADKR